MEERAVTLKAFDLSIFTFARLVRLRTVPTAKGEMMSGNRVIPYRGIGERKPRGSRFTSVRPHLMRLSPVPQLKEKRTTACAVGGTDFAAVFLRFYL